MATPTLVPELYVSSLRVSLEFYLDVLGFRVEYERPEDKFAAISLGAAHIMLEETPLLARATPEEFQQGQWRPADLERPFGRGINLEIKVDDINVANERIEARGYALLLKIHERVYRLRSENRKVRQLLVADPDGYLIRLSEFV
jgi:catechol 2,3-dioxygenase-like lactoylglutathione lyase family enzyme